MRLRPAASVGPRDLTKVLEDELGKKPEHVHIVIQEIEEEDWGFAGQLTDEWRKGQEPG